MASATERKLDKDKNPNAGARTKYPIGSWEAKWREPDPVTGKLKWKSKRGFHTKKEALAYAKRIEADIERGEHIPQQLASTRFKDVAEDWLESKVFDKPRTADGYASLLRNHVLPTFGPKAVGNVTKADIKTWVKERQSDDVGAGTIRNAYRNVLKPVLDHAMDSGMIKVNPATGVKLPRADHVEMLYLTADEVQVLADELGDDYGLLVTFAAYTGLRAGELAALKVKSLDLMRRKVNVKEAASPVRGKGTVDGPTKTYAIRSVTLPKPLIEPLMEYVAPRANGPDAYVFVSREGHQLHHGNFYRRHFRPAVLRLVGEGKLPTAKAGLRFHDLRHTCAALMANQPGADPFVVMKRMGHSSITVTYDRYGKLFPEREESVTDSLGATLLAAMEKQTAG